MSLTNADLAPTPASARTWTAKHYAALWVGMAVCIPTYTLAASLIDQGMNAWQALACVALGNSIVLVPMLLNAHAGAKYGIPFPVFARAAFGVLGANVPALLRALVACGWFGIQTWIGGLSLYQLARTAAPSLANVEAPLSSATALLGITPGQLLCFAIFWTINLWFILRGTDSIKWLETFSAPFLIAAGLALLVWARVRAGGFGPMLSAPSKFATSGELLKVFAPGLTAMVGFWATLSLNIPDFTRYARSQKDQAVGQALGLPTTMLLFAFIGVAVTSATPLLFGRTIWDPVELLGKVGGPLLTLFSMLALSVATLTTNLAANVVSPANDFSNLAPSRISFKTGGVLTALIGALILPWKLIETSHGYIYNWLVGYSALLGPIGGILIADYFFLRRKHLEVGDLYRRGGAYEYRRGVNGVAILALAVGVAVNVPGFLGEAIPSWKASFDERRRLIEAGSALATGGDALRETFRSIYTYAWFVGFFLSGALYLAGSRLRPAPR
ncbi:MAG TPA: NCS1 family nucleobase:cation symporter-1 [Planctomycetota bacterium]|jgi:NCS1 family nucleobase:cation symporter-1|nr:NCS1 family nucleobase:cation symporter-1 [Planctomycetota bacterium]